jgi:hypothetical protein
VPLTIPVGGLEAIGQHITMLFPPERVGETYIFSLKRTLPR